MFSKLIFDLDGTLIDSAEDIIYYVKKAIEEFTGIGKVEIDRKVIGPPLETIINNTIPNADKKIKSAIVNRFRELYFSCNFDRTKLIDGVESVLKYFSENGVEAYIATNKPMMPTKEILKKLKVKNIKQIVTADCLPAETLDKEMMIRKIIDDNNLEKEKIFMVGDTASDIKAAKNNSIKSVGFLGGYGAIEEILSANPDYKIKNMIELISLIKF